jgi:hypothetical protein
MPRVVLFSILLLAVMAKEDIWVKEEKFDPLKPFNPHRVVLYAPKGCILDTMPGVSPI